MRPDIYSYLDYRKYLQDLTLALKTDTQFNLRAFASKAGIKAPGYLKMVIDRRRNLTIETTQKFCRALEIRGKACEYFQLLVLYNQSKDPDLKKEYFDQINKLRPRSTEYIAEKQQLRYFSRPHYVTVREMVTLKDFQEDPKWIAHRCFPRIRPSDAKEAIDTLLELGLLKRHKNGTLIQTEDFVRTEDLNTQAVEAYHFHEAKLNEARHALGRLPQHERNYYALTMPIPKTMFNDIIAEFYTFRDKVREMVDRHEGDFDDVYQINFQLFPVTKGGDTS